MNEEDMKSVATSAEDLLFNGDTSVDGSTIYGYTTHPNRQKGGVTKAWSIAEGTQIKNDVKEMLKKANAANRSDPFYLYVAKDIWANLGDDYPIKHSGIVTIKNRIELFPGIEAVKVGDSLAEGNVVLVQMAEYTVDLAIAMDIRNVQWELKPMRTDFRIFNALAPQVKANKNNQCGVVHYS